MFYKRGNENQLKIAIIGPQKSIGGISSHIGSLSSGLSAIGDVVTLIPRVEYDGPDAFLYYLKRVLSDVDIIHIQGLQYFNPLIASFLARGMIGMPVVVTAHGFGGESSWWKSQVKKDMMRILTRRTDLIISISLYVQNRILRFFGTDVKVATIYNGINTDFFNPNINGDCIRKRLNLEGRFIVLFVGRLAWNKGLPDLIKAVAIAKTKISNIALLICGRGKLLDEVKKEVNILGIENLVRFIGFVETRELPSYYASSDVVCFPSIFEPFGLVPLEAMSMSRPVIATEVGGIPEAVKDGENGILVPPRSPSRLAEALSELALNPSLRYEMGRKGRKIVEERFSIERMARETHKYYTSLLNKV
jgi:glycosyltransferase involved in cell wall biosynthesis